MSRYIDAEYDLHDLPYYYDFSDEELSAIHSAMRGIPTADVREVVHGEWIRKADWKNIPTVCSHCKHEFNEYVEGYEWEETGDLPNYCPHCGAIMRNAVQT